MSSSDITLASLGYGPGATNTTSTPEMQLPIATKASTSSNGKLGKGVSTSVEDRALSLLGSGVMPESVAAALGVTASYISQLLSDDEFAAKVATLRYEALQSHNLRDESYDTIEDKLLIKLSEQLHLLLKPQDILKAINTINGAKRRGQSAPDQIVNKNNIVNLVLPKVAALKFTVNVDNQVTRAGEQELLTMASSTLLKKAEQEEEIRANLLEHTGEVVLDL